MEIVLETERLYLRELSSNDAEDLAQVLCDPDSMKYYPQPFDIEGVKNWISRNIRRYEIYGYGLWGIVLRESDRLIGDCGVTIQNIDNELLPEIGFHVIPSCCRMGYASEAGKAVLSFCNATYKISKFYSYCARDNIPSIRTMERIGMEFHKKYFADGKEKTVYIKEFR